MLDVMYVEYLSRVVRKPAFCICENKDVDQLRSNREADQRLCFCYTDSTISLLSKYEIASLQPSSHLLWLYSPVCVGPGRQPRRPVFSQRGSFPLEAAIQVRDCVVGFVLGAGLHKCEHVLRLTK